MDDQKIDPGELIGGERLIDPNMQGQHDSGRVSSRSPQLAWPNENENKKEKENETEGGVGMEWEDNPLESYWNEEKVKAYGLNKGVNTNEEEAFENVEDVVFGLTFNRRC